MTNPKRPIRCSYDASDYTRSGLNGVRHSRMRRGGITDKRATKNWHACEMSFGRLPAYLPLNLVFPRMMGCSAATPTLPYAVVQENCSLPCMRSQKPMDPPENAAMTALCARLLLDDPSLTLAVGGADLFSLHIAHGVCYDTRADLRKVLSLGTLHLLLMVAF